MAIKKNKKLERKDKKLEVKANIVEKKISKIAPNYDPDIVDTRYRDAKDTRRFVRGAFKDPGDAQEFVEKSTPRQKKKFNRLTAKHRKITRKQADELEDRRKQLEDRRNQHIENLGGSQILDRTLMENMRQK